MSASKRGGGPGYETSDARIPVLVASTLGLVVLIGVSMAVSAWVDRSLTAGVREGQQASPLSALREQPPGPDLQAVPNKELRAKRAWEEQQLTGIEWVDPVNGIIRIPIDRAIELTLKEGLPVREREEGR